MASYKIEWKRSALRELEKLPRQMVVRIIRAVENLALDPYLHGTRKLTSTEQAFRIRVGDYRVVYSIHAEKFIVEIVRVKHRKDVYKRRI